MLAARYYGPHQIKLDDIEEPQAGPGELVLEVEASNMCGTDLKAYLRGHPMLRPPVTMGHEFAGVVSEVGKGGSVFKKGERVVASNSAPCGECEMCRRGSYTLCKVTERELIGFGLPGSYAQFVRIPNRIALKNTYKYSGGVYPAEIACAEPLAAVVHALDKVRVRDGSRVAVVGSGALGLMFLQMLKSLGAKVMVVNRSEGRLGLAEKLGADQTIVADESNLSERVREATDGIGADLVVEAVGRGETWEAAFRAARSGGQVLLFGGCASGTVVSFDAHKIHYGETDLVGSFHHETTAFRRAVSYIENGRVKVKPLLSAEMKLENITEAFDRMERREVMKITLIP